MRAVLVKSLVCTARGKKDANIEEMIVDGGFHFHA